MFKYSIFIYITSLLVFLIKGEGNVISLSDSDFDDVMDGSLPSLVEFYAPWCGHCKTLAPIYEELGDAFQHVKDKVNIIKVDADSNKAIGQRFGVNGFPTLKWFPKGEKKNPVDYAGGRDLESLSKFITEKTGLKSKIKPTETFVKVLVEFYAPWCGHCKTLAPIYEKVAKNFQTEKNCVVANLDATVHKGPSDKYEVTGFPTLKFFGAKNKEPIPYNGGRTEEDITKFLNEHCGTFRVPGGGLNKNAGLIAEFASIVKKFFKATKQERLVIQKEFKDLATKFTNNKYTKYYVKVFEKVIEKGSDYIKKEVSRLTRLISGKNSLPEKIDEFFHRRNILESFFSDGEEEIRDEL
ncbi:hypothetical protein HK099_001904 [Clydaea vesicula]|uniref:protein disulfide-isomerase n=1 Tax=Clydaea vesicula TaxID=447962 RepID=A0AAD5TY15_9FUNG|nr:hypothetical protein HK099_001904 [Clydaea vesicula]